MNPQEKQQVAARDEKWIPFSKRVKISSTNIRLETTVPQKEETFQVVIDLIKNSTYFKAFTISADVPEIFMQQFWYSIKKVQGTDSYEFLLANKKCTVNAEVFRTILDICPRVEGVDFTNVPDDDTALTFLIDLGYNGLLYKHTNMFVDHMHQPWRTLTAIINKCLSGNTTNIHQVFYWSDSPQEWGDEQDSEHADDDNDDVKKDDKDGDADDEGDDHISDTQDADDEDVETESDEDNFISDEEVTDAAKADDEKTSKAKDDPKKTELPPSSSSLFVSSCFGDQFLKLSPDSSLVSTVKDTTGTEINSLLEIQSEVPNTQSPSVLIVPVSMISEPTVPTPVQESPLIDTATTLPPPFASITPFLKTIDHSTEALAILKSQVPSVVDNYRGSKFSESAKKQTLIVDLEQGSEKSASEILQIKRKQAEKQQRHKFTIKSTDKAALEEYDLKSALYQSMHANKRRTKESKYSKKPSSTKETSKGKAPTKGSKTGKSGSAKELVEEPIAEVVMDDAGDDVARYDNQPQDTLEPKTRKTLNPNWFKQPPRPPTPDPEWNKCQDPLTFNDLMAAPIDFSKYEFNGLKIENLTQDILLGPAFNLLKGTCSSSIELEYNFQECFNALTYKLNWNNLEGDHYPFDLSKPLPLQEVTYTSSITKTNETRYEIKGVLVVHLMKTTQDALNPRLLRFRIQIGSSKLQASTHDPEWNKHLGSAFNLLKGTCSSSIELKYNFQECFNALTDKLDWNNPEGDRYPFDLSKPLPLQGPPGHRTIVVDYFFNNDMEYLKTSDPEVSKFSKHNIYSTKVILGVKSVSDFVDLHLNDIEDMLLVVVQHKLFHHEWSVIVDFIVALRMFTRSLILKRYVKDLQLV
ncbi:hypothetical protein Tco_0766413 [Tanacetum coccineum]